MPVLMNKGADPRKAAWLFYTTRAVLADLGQEAVEGRFESGVLTVDAADIDAAAKPGSEVPVYLEIETVVPEGVDLEAARGELVRRAQGTVEGAAPAYEAIPAAEDLRVAIGTTTRLAAQNYLHEQELDGQPWRPELPGLQMLAQLIDLMAQSGSGIPPCMVWHVDEGGIMRMAPAKQVKPMAGNTLKVKL